MEREKDVVDKVGEGGRSGKVRIKGKVGTY